MTKRKIITEPDTILRKKSVNLEKVDDDLRELMDDMLETMYAAPGIGLAGVQIGILKRMIVIDVSKDEEKKSPLFLINPEIITKSRNTSVYEEGCLSLPGYFAEIERPAECQIEYVDYYGKKKEMRASGLLATCIQHEVDHLNGVLYTERLADKKAFGFEHEIIEFWKNEKKN